MKQLSARIIKNAPLSSDYYEMSMDFSSIDEAPCPGQFLTLRVSPDTVPLLRRPFAYASWDSETSIGSIIYQRRGRGTDLLAAKLPGDLVDVIGPLGRPFPEPAATATAILVAGGIGLGPIMFLGSDLQEKNRLFQFVFGCRTAALLPDSEAFSRLRPVICTDDGSAGFNGTVVEYLETTGNDSGNKKGVIYSCGPMKMLFACHEFAVSRSWESFVAVEQIMACGVGACMGCVVRVKSEARYARACKEGPVFDSRDMEWEQS